MNIDQCEVDKGILKVTARPARPAKGLERIPVSE